MNLHPPTRSRIDRSFNTAPRYAEPAPTLGDWLLVAGCFVAMGLIWAGTFYAIGRL